jgi:phage tail sheath protein FI
VYIEEVPSGVRTINGVATSIGLFIGWAARGAVGKAVRITSFAGYEREYGGLDLRTLLGYSVKQFFDNGGADAYVVRLAVASGDVSVDVPDAAIPASSGTKIDDLKVTASSPGAWGNVYAVRTRLRAADNTRFKIEVVRVVDPDPAKLDTNPANPVVETFENLSMDPGDARFAENVINGRSNLITVLVARPAAPAPPPDPPTDATTALTDGDDGTVLSPEVAGQIANAFYAAVLAKFGVGSITEQIDIFNLVCVPGLARISANAAATLQELQRHCHDRRAFLLVDAASGLPVDDMRDDGTDDLTNANAINSAIFFPWVTAPDPLQQGALREYPPCGFVAGIYARTDATRGVWKAPAGTDASLVGATGLAIKMSDAENGQLNPLGINCLRDFPVFGKVVWGARTLNGENDRASEWKYVPVRRVALFLEESLYRGTKWVVFEPNDEPLWAQIRLNIGAFMNSLFRQGAFQGRTPREAYFVKCDRDTTTQTDINSGIVKILVGFAPLKPAEFVVLRIQQIAGEIGT